MFASLAIRKLKRLKIILWVVTGVPKASEYSAVSILTHRRATEKLRIHGFCSEICRTGNEGFGTDRRSEHGGYYFHVGEK
jgi:hypothetical protein